MSDSTAFTKPDRPDFATMLLGRVESNTRLIYKAPISFKPELYYEHGQAVQAQLEWREEQKYRSDDGRPADPRLVPQGNPHEADVTRLEQEIKESSALAVFVAPTSDEQEEFNGRTKGMESLEKSRALMTQCFQRWEYEGEEITELTLDHLQALFPVLSQGETYSIGNTLATMSGGTPDIPKSVLESLKTRRPAATSR